MKIIKLEISDNRWRSFLKTTPHLVFHIPEYKQFIEHAFRCKANYYAAIDENEQIKTIFPLYAIKHLMGNKVISTAYIEYGGPCGDGQYTQQIIEHAKQEYPKVGFIEIRQGLETFDETLSKLAIKSVDYKRFILPLKDVETTFANIEKAKRKTIKKAERGGVITREVTKEEIPLLYKLYLQNMRRFGSPPYNKHYFKHFFNDLISKRLGKCFGAYHQDKLVSALLGFTYQDRIHVIIAVSDPKYQELRVNDAVHWEFIKWGCNNNYKIFDFGRVREDSGHFTYKKRWGAELKDLNHYYLLIKSKTKPEVDPNKHKLITKVWSKLPLWTTRLFGHWLREGLGI